MEPVNANLQHFYDGLLALLRQPTVRDGRWQLLECRPAWGGNWTWDGFIAFAWSGPEHRRMVVAVNYARNQGQCDLRLPFEDLLGHAVRLQDRMSAAVYDRNGDALLAPGLYLDMPPWGYHVFDVTGGCVTNTIHARRRGDRGVGTE